MLELRPYCASCVDEVLHGVCPHYGGGFMPRPIRPPARLADHPASVRRVVRATCP